MRPWVLSHSALILGLLLGGCTVVVDGQRKPPVVDASAPDSGTEDAGNDLVSVDVSATADANDASVTTDTHPTDIFGHDVASGDLGGAADAFVELDGSDGSGSDVAEDAGPPGGGGPGEFVLDTANDFTLSDGVTGTLTVDKEHAIVFPVDRSTPVKDLKQYSPTDLATVLAEFSCLGNANVQAFFPDTVQPGPGSTLKLLAGNPIGDALSAVDIITTDSATVLAVFLELPFEVPQDNKAEFEPGPLCYGVLSQGDWFFSFDPMPIQVDESEDFAMAALPIDFPAKADAVAVLTGQDIAISVIRYTAAGD